MEKIYEVECQRNNVTPMEFWNYCKKRTEAKSGYLWLDDFSDWESPLRPEEYHVNEHKDWESPQKEALKFKPFDCQMFLQNAYNFIMEFEYDTETRGHGYLYVVEYGR